jgi:hypothetical protein
VTFLNNLFLTFDSGVIKMIRSSFPAEASAKATLRCVYVRGTSLSMIHTLLAPAPARLSTRALLTDEKCG